MIKECKHHGHTEYALRKTGRWRCKKCAVDAVTKRRRKVKRLLIEAAGGKCVRCGYDKCQSALEFHHRDREDKSFTISMKQYLALDKCLEEIKKCDLVCANCHAEIEDEYYAPVP